MASYIWQVLMHDAGFPAMITPRSARVMLSSWAKAARAAPGPESRETPASRTYFVFLVGLPEPAAKIGLEVVGDAAPGFQQLFVGINAALDVRLVRPKEGLHRLGRQSLAY